MKNNGLLICLVIAVAIDQVYSQCPRGWTHHYNSCYLLHSKDKFDWIESQMFCAGYNAHLAYVDDYTENTFIKGMIVQDIHETGAGVWIGASDYEVEGHYVWYGTGKPVTISDWQPGEPNSHQEDCLIYWGDFNWKWADGNCHNQYYFICEKPVENVIDVG